MCEKRNPMTGNDKPNTIAANLRFSRFARKNRTSPFENLKVLDAICKSGDICAEALANGAVSATGLCLSEELAQAAKSTCAQGNFIKGAWDDLPKGFYDIVFVSLHALDEFPDRSAFKTISRCMAPNATLIIECNVARETNQTVGWRLVSSDGVQKRYPTLKMLTEVILERFDSRQVNRFALDGAGEIQRVVLHAQLRMHTAILLTGKGGIGKSNLMRLFRRQGIPSYLTDELLGRLVRVGKFKVSSRFDSLVAQNYSSGNLNLASRFIEENDLAMKFADIIARECPKEFPVFIIEGEALNHASIFKHTCTALARQGVRAVKMTKLAPVQNSTQ